MYIHQKERHTKTLIHRLHPYFCCSSCTTFLPLNLFSPSITSCTHAVPLVFPPFRPQHRQKPVRHLIRDPNLTFLKVHTCLCTQRLWFETQTRGLWNAVARNRKKKSIILFEKQSIACGPTDLTHAPYVKRSTRRNKRNKRRKYLSCKQWDLNRDQSSEHRRH